MTQSAKAQEPSMEEILASIRRIIADDDGKPAGEPQAEAKPEPVKAVRPVAPPAVKPASRAPEPSKTQAAPPKTATKPAPPPAESNSQDDIDAMLAGLDAETSDDEIRAAEPDVLELTESMTVEPASPPFRAIEAQHDIEYTEKPLPGDAPLPRNDGPPGKDTMPLASAATVSAVNSAFNTLAHTVLSQNARTLEDLVREMLRPMLKSWLDDNLPGLVERLVKAEIERVSRGR